MEARLARLELMNVIGKKPACECWACRGDHMSGMWRAMTSSVTWVVGQRLIA